MNNSNYDQGQHAGPINSAQLSWAEMNNSIQAILYQQAVAQRNISALDSNAHQLHGLHLELESRVSSEHTVRQIEANHLAINQLGRHVETLHSELENRVVDLEGRYITNSIETRGFVYGLGNRVFDLEGQYFTNSNETRGLVANLQKKMEILKSQGVFVVIAIFLAALFMVI